MPITLLGNKQENFNGLYSGTHKKTFIAEVYNVVANLGETKYAKIKEYLADVRNSCGGWEAYLELHCTMFPNKFIDDRNESYFCGNQV
jgi:hypothetical protein